MFLTNKAPYLIWPRGDEKDVAYLLGVLSSRPLDWYARRFVEINLNFFILEGLVVPNLEDEDLDAVGMAAARLSCVDDRFADFASSVGVDVGPVDDEERNRLRAEIDGRIARAWDLNDRDLDVLFRDFTTDAVSPEYRERVRARLRELT